MLLRDFILGARELLKPLYPDEEAAAIVSTLCKEVLGVEKYTHVVDPLYMVSPEQEGRLLSLSERLCGGEPLQYVLGYVWFNGLRFNVSPDVLIPRPETEQLCGIVSSSFPACSRFEEMRILDLCTGSGCIAWTLALTFSGARVLGVDVSESALAVASSQPLSTEVSSRNAVLPVFAKYNVLFGADGFSSCVRDFPEFDGEFDIIVSNPPYVRESERKTMRANVLDYEPALSLFVPDSDPLIFYKAIADFAIKRLRPGGSGFVEVNEAFGDAVAVIFNGVKLSDVEVLKDFRDKNRFVRFKK